MRSKQSGNDRHEFNLSELLAGTVPCSHGPWEVCTVLWFHYVFAAKAKAKAKLALVLLLTCRVFGGDDPPGWTPDEGIFSPMPRMGVRGNETE